MAGGKLVAANTDAVHLSVTKADRRILIGEKLTHGQGAGGHPDVGEKAAYESLQELREAVAGSRILLLCAGLGGGTGTGAINVLAKALPGEGILKIGVVAPGSSPRSKSRQAGMTTCCSSSICLSLNASQPHDSMAARCTSSAAANAGWLANGSSPPTKLPSNS